MTNLVGAIVGGKYCVGAPLGQGGMGTVYEGEHRLTGARVAIKVLGQNTLDKEDLDRFSREARAAGVIESPHTVRVLDTGFDPELGRPFMVMERLVGQDLSRLLTKLGALPPDIATRIIAQAAAGLAKAHEVGVIHRDIKPANLFLADTGMGDVVVKILDFGIAKVKGGGAAHDGGLTQTGSMLGSPHYMSPEQAQGLRTIDHRTDIWSLGVVLHKMITGHTPHSHLDTVGQVIVAICSVPVRPIQEIAPWTPPQIARIVHRCLQIDPKDRYQSAQQLLVALEPFLASGPRLQRASLKPLPPDSVSVIAPTYVPGTEPDTLEAGPASSNPALAMNPALGSSPQRVVPREFGSSPAITTGRRAALVGTDPLTDAGVTTSATVNRGRRGLAIGVGVGAGLFAVAGVLIATQLIRRPALTASPGPVAAATATPQAEPALAPPPAAAEPKTSAARVAISPPGATVTVDGRDVAVEDGAIRFEGVVGSAHKVKVSHGGTSTEVDVAIAESGAVPSSIAVPGASAVVTTAVAARAAAPAAPRASARPTASPAAAAKPTGDPPKDSRLGAKRSFDE